MSMKYKQGAACMVASQSQKPDIFHMASLNSAKLLIMVLLSLSIALKTVGDFVHGGVDHVRLQGGDEAVALFEPLLREGGGGDAGDEVRQLGQNVSTRHV